MGKVMTIRGEIDIENMGFTDIHTHLLMKLPDDFVWPADTASEIRLDKTKMTENALEFKLENLHDLRRGYWGFAKQNYLVPSIATMKSELETFAKAGGKTIIDGSPTGMRADLNALKKLSDELDINIILSSGFYSDGLWPKEYTVKSEKELIEFMLNEVENGLDGTRFRPGQIKAACNYFNDLEKKGLRATANVARETGLCYQVHTGGGRLNPDITCEMASIIKNAGMNLEKTIFLHMDQFVKQCDLKKYITDYDNATQLNLDPIRRVLNTGATISFDCIGNHESKELYYYVQPSDYDRMAALYTLIKEGYSKQIVLGSDVGQVLYFRKYGGAGFVRISEFVIPMLKAVGVSETDISNITINNPARLYNKAL